MGNLKSQSYAVDQYRKELIDFAMKLQADTAIDDEYKKGTIEELNRIATGLDNLSMGLSDQYNSNI